MPSSHRTRLYFDNAATSFPKPPGVLEAMTRYMTDIGASGRGSYAEARETARLIRRCRERICRLINGENPDHVVFTHNTSDALNLAIKGVLMHALRHSGGLRAPGRKPHVVLTTMEHNSVLRPINAMAADGLVDVTVVPADPRTFLVNPEDVRRAIRAGDASSAGSGRDGGSGGGGQTVLVCINHASNVTGTIQDVEAIGRICAEARRANSARGTDGAYPLLMVDAAQSLGHIGVDVRGAVGSATGGIDLLAFPGHKGLLGPTGTGGLYIRPDVEHLLDTVREGGTGSSSEQETHPPMLPEKYEAGSHNAAGIIGLSEGVAWLLDRGMAGAESGGRGGSIREHELTLLQAMDESLARLGSGPGFADDTDCPAPRLLGSAPRHRRVGVYSLIHPSLSPHELAAILESEFGILTRAGLACAPLAHKAAAAERAAHSGARHPDDTNGLARAHHAGATRLSLGPFLTRDDIERACAALADITRTAGRSPDRAAALARP